ncbi:hypothetical protein ASPBRDRAFT_47933 [Aspergillus brasiliensis CBS 101740]|uniref:Uncharacterized protein n=1 Tax=Aspergillus brasiliensis (strain CBS 101740 / IMI 381727 / IBT 21946) TaxID=767769 RepID=A0A1L9U6V4_ASPBC|nr:hypothetical protein ASPBRDRAFT_47933 [Aspergillus brasiliensis CBS 101740]
MKTTKHAYYTPPPPPPLHTPDSYLLPVSANPKPTFHLHLHQPSTPKINTSPPKSCRIMRTETKPNQNQNRTYYLRISEFHGL